MVAAATTSLPERMESVRNYDYRYAWIRDQCYTGLAVAAHGPHPLLDGAVRFITERVLADGPDLMPAYTVAGDPLPGERTMAVRGYPGGAAARTGNRVTGQFQLDAFGEVLQLLAAAARLDLDGPDTWRAARSPRTPSGNAGPSRTPGCGSSIAAALGPFPAGLRGRAARDRPGGRPRRRRGTGGPARRRPSGAAWPTRSWPACTTRSTRPAAGSGPPATRGSTRRCCCR